MTARWETHPKTLKALKTLVRHDAVPWGCLKDLTTAEEVSCRLIALPPVIVPDLSTPLIRVYHTTDLGVGCVARISACVLQTALETGQMPPETLVTLRFRHGNLFCTIKAQELPPQISLSQDVYLMVDPQANALFATHIGKYHWHHLLYQYKHLDGKVTTLKKLLESKRFTSIYIDTGGDELVENTLY